MYKSDQFMAIMMCAVSAVISGAENCAYLVQRDCAWDRFFREISLHALHFAKKPTRNVQKIKRCLYTNTWNAEKKSQDILLPLFAIAFMKIYGHFFVAASRFTTREINTMLKLSSINISLKMNINWWVNSSLDFLFHLFALLFIACYTLIHSDISLNANWHSKRFTDRPFHRSTQWNTALIFLPPFGSNNQLPFES